MGDGLNITYSGKIQGGTSRCGSPKDVGAYYLYGSELTGALEAGKTTCDNKNEKVNDISRYWENAANIVLTRRESPALISRFNRTNNYQKEVAAAVLGKIISLKHPDVSLGAFSGANWLNCFLSFTENVAPHKVPLKLEAREVEFSLKQGEGALVKVAPPSSPTSIDPGAEGIVKFNLVAPTVGISLNGQNHGVQRDFTGTISLVLSRTSKLQLLGHSVRSVAPGTVEVTAKIKVPAGLEAPEALAEKCSDNFLRFLAIEAMFGELIVNYDGSKITSVPLSRLIALGDNPVPEITDITPKGARRGRTANVTISGQNIPSNVKLEANASMLEISNIQVSEDGKNITATIKVNKRASLGAKTISVIDTVGNSEIGSVSFSVYRRGGGGGSGSGEGGDPPPPPPPTRTKPPCPDTPAGETLRRNGLCEGSGSGPKPGRTPRPGPQPKPGSRKCPDTPAGATLRKRGLCE